MEIGILGLPQSGKSTLFEIMTGIKSHSSHGESCVRGQAVVPDKRLDLIAKAYPREKVIQARIPFVDVNAVGEKAWDAMRQNLSGTEAILHIIDGFTVPDLEECIHQYRKLEEELILSDLMIVENRLQKLQKTPKNAMKALDLQQLDLLPRAREHLEEGKPLRGLDLSAEESFALRSFSFWSIKPEMVVINEAEDNRSLTESFRGKAGLASPVLGICCQMESELAGLSPEDQKEFLISMGIDEPAFEKIIHAAFALLGRISFFTIGDHEIRAWVIPEGSKAPKAASAIHKDFERGFIKAEVASFDDFNSHGNTVQGVKAAGRLRLEGKEYVVKDGDIITFRFNV